MTNSQNTYDNLTTYLTTKSYDHLLVVSEISKFLTYHIT